MEIKVPEVGESVYEAEISKWHKQDGDRVKKDDLLCELETDKITLELNADADGVLSIQADEGETVEVGAVIGAIEEEGKKEEAKGDRPKAKEEKAEKKEAKEEKAEKKAEGEEGRKEEGRKQEGEKEKAEKQEAKGAKAEEKEGEERIDRRPMSRIRRRIAERLVAARKESAILTTFNEADLSRVIELRRKHRDQFEKKHGVALGFMSFFIKAAVEALQEYPEVNARIDGDDIVYQHFYNIGVAIGAEKGLVVPVLRDADRLHFAEIEKTIKDFVDKAQNNRLDLSDLEGGTFTLSNGGVYGSLLSTPILNPPQSGVLGMHVIQDRPVARDGEVVIRPMMYLALSYDHRIIDGRQAVGFLKLIKEYVEEPEEMLLEL